LLSHLDSQIVAFSWDGSLAVTEALRIVRLIRWQVPSIVWERPFDGTYVTLQAFPEPGGSAVAIGIANPAYAEQYGYPPVDLYVVSAEGKVVMERKETVLLLPTSLSVP
jgi:hypothetical protein